MRALVVEDDRQTSEYIRSSLAERGWQAETAFDGEDGLSRARREVFDVIIVDRMLPKLDGLALVSTLRAEGGQTPVLFLTAMGAISDRVAGLEGGGDDYLVKPFSLAEFNARVAALTRRPAMATARGDAVLQVGDITLDRLERCGWVGARMIELLPLQFKLLEFLMLNEGRVVTRSMLLERVWGFRFDPRTNIVETHISHLRAKIDMPGQASPIVTVRGAGYMINARPAAAAAAFVADSGA
jgi:two-component system OmpR family response regulator